VLPFLLPTNLESRSNKYFDCLSDQGSISQNFFGLHFLTLFGKPDYFATIQIFSLSALKRFGLEIRVSHYTLKKFYEIDPALFIIYFGGP